MRVAQSHCAKKGREAAEGGAMRPAGFGMALRERNSRHIIMPAAEQGKRGRKARNPGVATFADSEAEKTRWKQPGKNALLEGRFSITARRKAGFPNTKSENERPVCPGKTRLSRESS